MLAGVVLRSRRLCTVVLSWVETISNRPSFPSGPSSSRPHVLMGLVFKCPCHLNALLRAILTRIMHCIKLHLHSSINLYQWLPTGLLKE